MWWIRGGRIGHELLSFPGVRLVLPQVGRMEATTRNAVNGRSETGRNGQAIEHRVVVHGYRLGRTWDLREGESRLEFRDRTAAAWFLQRLATDSGVLATLRSAYASVGASGAIHRLGDRVVVDQLAGHLVDRSLEVVVAGPRGQTELEVPSLSTRWGQRRTAQSAGPVDVALCGRQSEEMYVPIRRATLS